MFASDLVKSLNKIIEEHGDLELIYSVDEEGNRFEKVYFGAAAGHFEDREFYSYDDTENFKECNGEINAICIN